MATQLQQEHGSFDGAFDSVDFTDASDLIQAVLGVKPRLVQEYDLTQIDPDGRVQVRIDKNNAPKEMVERFAGQMSFSAFPPIVVTQDARIVDGNTRFRARLVREDRFCSALVIPVEFAPADEGTQTRIEYLGLALNNSNGKALDKVERRKMVKDALEMGMSTRQIQQTVGFPKNTINAIKHELDGEVKLERVGLKELGKDMKDATLRALGRVDNLNDQPFAELATLAADAGFSAPEIQALAASVRDVGSDELGLERIARERDTNAQRIADRKRGGNGQPPAARIMRQRLGFVLGKEPSALVETNRERMSDHLEMVDSVIELLQVVAARQREALAAVVPS